MRKEQSFGPKSDFGPKPRFRSQIVTKSTQQDRKVCFRTVEFRRKRKEAKRERRFQHQRFR